MSEKRTLSDYSKPAISVDKLDLLAESIFSGAKNPSYIQMIFTTIKFIMALTYISVRRKLINDELEIISQTTRNSEIEDNRSEVDDDIEGY